jgi:hypothetical protein
MDVAQPHPVERKQTPYLSALASLGVGTDARHVRRNIVVHRQHLADGGDRHLEEQSANLLAGLGAGANGLVAIAIGAGACEHVGVEREVLAIAAQGAGAALADAAVNGGQVVPSVARGAGVRKRARSGRGKVAVLHDGRDFHSEARVAADGA